MIKQILIKIRIELVSGKYLLQRGYAWLQIPTLITIGAGVMKPYFPQFRFWQLAISAFCLFLFVGWVDRTFKFIHEEQSLVTKLNPTLMEGLYGNKNGNRTS